MNYITRCLVFLLVVSFSQPALADDAGGFGYTTEELDAVNGYDVLTCTLLIEGLVIGKTKLVQGLKKLSELTVSHLDPLDHYTKHKIAELIIKQLAWTPKQAEGMAILLFKYAEKTTYFMGAVTITAAGLVKATAAAKYVLNSCFKVIAVYLDGFRALWDLGFNPAFNEGCKDCPYIRLYTICQNICGASASAADQRKMWDIPDRCFEVIPKGATVSAGEMIRQITMSGRLASCKTRYCNKDNPWQPKGPSIFPRKAECRIQVESESQSGITDLEHKFLGTDYDQLCGAIPYDGGAEFEEVTEPAE